MPPDSSVHQRVDTENPPVPFLRLDREPRLGASASCLNSKNPPHHDGPFGTTWQHVRHASARIQDPDLMVCLADPKGGRTETQGAVSGGRKERAQKEGVFNLQQYLYNMSICLGTVL